MKREKMKSNGSSCHVDVQATKAEEDLIAEKGVKREKEGSI